MLTYTSPDVFSLSILFTRPPKDSKNNFLSNTLSWMLTRLRQRLNTPLQKILSEHKAALQKYERNKGEWDWGKLRIVQQKMMLPLSATREKMAVLSD